jgi:hypothetical protein
MERWRLTPVLIVGLVVAGCGSAPSPTEAPKVAQATATATVRPFVPLADATDISQLTCQSWLSAVGSDQLSWVQGWLDARYPDKNPFSFLTELTAACKAAPSGSPLNDALTIALRNASDTPATPTPTAKPTITPSPTPEPTPEPIPGPSKTEIAAEVESALDFFIDGVQKVSVSDDRVYVEYRDSNWVKDVLLANQYKAASAIASLYSMTDAGYPTLVIRSNSALGGAYLESSTTGKQLAAMADFDMSETDWYAKAKFKVVGTLY